MKRLTFIFCAVLVCSMVSAKDIERVSITYEYYSNNPNEEEYDGPDLPFEEGSDPEVKSDETASSSDSAFDVF